MCGVSGVFGGSWGHGQVKAMVAAQHHRGPDASAVVVLGGGSAALGHNRLSIIDRSAAGTQPMASADGRFWIAFNGEVYNYLELRRELADYPFRTGTDTEVVLAGFQRWGASCLDRFVGMFAFLVWDERDRRLFAARDRFGVKPLYYHAAPDGSLVVASEIKALAAAGVALDPDPVSWATYFTHGTLDHTDRTFWSGIDSLPPGHLLVWRDGRLAVAKWYDLADRVGPELDPRPASAVREEYRGLLTESVRLRFRSDVPVGINLSGGLDSSILLGLVHEVRGADDDVQAFTFVTNDPAYDVLPWVRQMLAHTRHELVSCALGWNDVPALAESVQASQDEPFGGIPTLAYARLFEEAHARGVVVLLDGQGMDEQWAGYDYYARALGGGPIGTVQGASDSPVRAECLVPEFRELAAGAAAPTPYPDALRNAQYRDLRYTKLPRALRFNDRASMRSSVELREPFLDHRLVELAFRQPSHHKLAHGVHKRLLRDLAAELIPDGLAEAPKRPVQTPQREWLRGPLSDWAQERIAAALTIAGGSWLDADAVSKAWKEFESGRTSTSYFVWQWVSAGMLLAGSRVSETSRAPLQAVSVSRGTAA